MNSALMFSKASDEWSTPQAFYDALDLEFRFDWDAAASRKNAKCGGYRYFGLDHTVPVYQDALAVDWVTLNRRRLFCNPPYSKCREFIAKAANEAKRGLVATAIVCLVPARTDTRWFHDHVWDDVRHCARPGVEVRFIKGRLKFGSTDKAENSAPFPSVVIIFRADAGAVT